MVNKLPIDNYIRKLKETNTPLNTFIPLTIDNIEWFWSKFKCLKCGDCCTKLSEIAVISLETKIIAEYLNVSHKSIKNLAHVEHGLGHLPMPCPYYKDGCTIYHVRPAICESYPLLKPYEKDGIKYLSLSTACKGAEEICLELIQQRLKSLLR